MKNERQLLRSARELDEEALLAIFDYYAPKVYEHALRKRRDPVRADETVRQVFERLLDELAAGGGPNRDLATYLYQSADRWLAEGL